MEDEARPRKKVRRTARSGLTPFALRLAKQLSDGVGSGNNLVFSPLSIYRALALVAAGAGGETLDEFLALLGAASRDELAEFARGMPAASALADDDRSGSSGGPIVAFTCGVWYQNTVALKPAYRAAAVESYKAKMRAANFLEKAEKVRKEINKWVSKATNELITSILPKGSVHSETALVLANAIYFKGTWSTPFVKERTVDKEFHRLDGSCVRAPFMHSTEDQFIKEHDGFKVLKLPYRNSSASAWYDVDDDWGYEQQSDERPRFSMCIFLPDARDGLPGLVDKMASSSCSFQLRGRHLPTRRVKVGKFWLPKFKLSYSSQMNEVLKAMGLEAVFSPHEADLSNMVEDDDELYMDHVFHKAVVKVDEEGTEAEASTACTIRKVALHWSPVTMDFIADHPFVFLVVEEASGAVVFMGQVLDPTRSE
ncbi:hypothetical protein SEVIR_8G174600v4 [Setaria viridis]|uniref:Serpin domain-containing protein n=1 Tax=Setaria viridis TaxID=4556 RepID=A0A4U6TI76_SETVI|nr:hypothetical protein SEVIR_8G174600v2 [Setaria viridis]